MATGPAYVPGAPEIDNPGVLPMAPDEPGDTLFVSGVVRSTTGKPLAGAVIDFWQTTADGRYAGLTPEQAGPLEGLDVVDFDLPKYHLRGKIVADAEGRYEYRTVVPGVEPAAVPGSLLDDLLHMLGRANSRARHIHAHVTHEDHHMLTHQIHFDGDPLVDTVSEGAIARELIHKTELHEDVAAWEARGLTARTGPSPATTYSAPSASTRSRTRMSSRASGNSDPERPRRTCRPTADVPPRLWSPVAPQAQA